MLVDSISEPSSPVASSLDLGAHWVAGLQGRRILANIEPESAGSLGCDICKLLELVLISRAFALSITHNYAYQSFRSRQQQTNTGLYFDKLG
jgi:hypothetical protein